MIVYCNNHHLACWGPYCMFIAGLLPQPPNFSSLPPLFSCSQPPTLCFHRAPLGCIHKLSPRELVHVKIKSPATISNGFKSHYSMCRTFSWLSVHSLAHQSWRASSACYPFLGEGGQAEPGSPRGRRPLLLPTTHAASSGVLGQSPQVLIKIYWTHEISKKMTKLKRQVQYISVVHSVV